MFRPICILSLVFATTTPALPQAANLSDTPGASGAVAQLITAQRGYDMALASGDPILLLAVIRLARGVVLRQPTAWQRATEGKGPPDQPTGRTAAPDPAGDQAITTVRAMVGDDPVLQDLVHDLDAQLPQTRKKTAVAKDADVGAGQVDQWRMPLSGAVPTEIGLIGDGDGALSLTVMDETGATICILPASTTPALCPFTPARNGFFTITIRNEGAVQNSYRLLAS